jgi:hypothetical protein
MFIKSILAGVALAAVTQSHANYIESFKSDDDLPRHGLHNGKPFHHHHYLARFFHWFEKDGRPAEVSSCVPPTTKIHHVPDAGSTLLLLGLASLPVALGTLRMQRQN